MKIVAAMKTAALAVGLLTACPPVAAPAADGPTERSPRLELKLSCDSTEARVDEPFFCEVWLLADPAGESAIIPRLWPPFQLPRWPEIVLQFEARDGAEIRTRLEVAHIAGLGRYDIFQALFENGLIHLEPGEGHGRRFDLNGNDWLLPKKPGTYHIVAELTMRLRARLKDGHFMSPGVEKLLRDAPEYEARIVPDGVWRSNEVVVEIRPAKP